VTVALSLAMMAGLAGAVGYLARLQVFTASMSGNSIPVGRCVAEGNARERPRPRCAIASHVVGVARGHGPLGLRISSCTTSVAAEWLTAWLSDCYIEKVLRVMSGLPVVSAVLQ
jgi:uncharacterized membrane protein YoaK (UPF0700 family)